MRQLFTGLLDLVHFRCGRNSQKIISQGGWDVPYFFGGGEGWVGLERSLCVFQAPRPPPPRRHPPVWAVLHSVGTRPPVMGEGVRWLGGGEVGEWVTGFWAHLVCQLVIVLCVSNFSPSPGAIFRTHIFLFQFMFFKDTTLGNRMGEWVSVRSLPRINLLKQKLVSMSPSVSAPGATPSSSPSPSPSPSSSSSTPLSPSFFRCLQ